MLKHEYTINYTNGLTGEDFDYFIEDATDYTIGETAYAVPTTEAEVIEFAKKSIAVIAEHMFAADTALEAKSFVVKYIMDFDDAEVWENDSVKADLATVRTFATSTAADIIEYIRDTADILTPTRVENYCGGNGSAEFINTLTDASMYIETGSDDEYSVEEVRHLAEAYVDHFAENDEGTKLENAAWIVAECSHYDEATNTETNWINPELGHLEFSAPNATHAEAVELFNDVIG